MPAYQSMDYHPPQFLNLRQVLAPEYALLPSARIASLMEQEFGPGAAEQYEEYLESIFGDIGKFFRKAAPVITRLGAGALQGATAGAALGPAGIIGGAILGGTGAGLSSYGKGTARKIGQAVSGVTNIAGQFTPTGKAGGAIGAALSGIAGKTNASRGLGAAIQALRSHGGSAAGGSAMSALGGLAGAGGVPASLAGLFGGTGAAGQLINLLQRPEVMQALAAANLGRLGRRNIAVGSGQVQVPAGAIMNLLRELADQATAESAALSDGGESELQYMTDYAGEFIGDPAVSRDRAERVWELLNEAQAERLLNAAAAYAQEMEEASGYYRNGDAYQDADEDYDEEMEIAEMYALPDESSDAAIFGEESGEYHAGSHEGEWYR